MYSKPRLGSRTSLHPVEEARLSVIPEDGETPPIPRVPQRAHNRPFSRRWNLGDPPSHSYEKSPPPYSNGVWHITGPKGEKLSDVRNNKYIARRGGWLRLCTIALVVLLLLVGLVAGLVVGLQRKSHHTSRQDDQSSPSTSNGTTNANSSFPVGSYALATFLDTTSTNCTSNPATWLCYPYKTYSTSPSAAMATFNWIITNSSSMGGNYTISSTDNPFAINFTNASLALVDAGSSTERYTFSIPINKSVVPSPAITSEMATCYFNNTNFEASLYTRLAKSYPENSSSVSTSSSPSSNATVGDGSAGGFEAWPYAVEVTQSIGGGTGVPDCYITVNGNIGERISSLNPEASADLCSCEYKNWSP